MVMFLLVFGNIGFNSQAMDAVGSPGVLAEAKNGCKFLHRMVSEIVITDKGEVLTETLEVKIPEQFLLSTMVRLRV